MERHMPQRRPMTDRGGKRARTIGWVAAAVVVVAASCSGGDDSDPEVATTTTTEAAVPIIAPLTGLEVDAALERPALVVKIDNND